jgi:lipoyl(octanoyl) transferase
MTGVWVKNASGTSAKICAIGVSARRWVTYHGLSLNVDLDLAPFDEIVPCGLFGRTVTSLSKEAGRQIDISDVDAVMSRSFAQAYGAAVEIGMV